MRERERVSERESARERERETERESERDRERELIYTRPSREVVVSSDAHLYVSLN